MRGKSCMEYLARDEEKVGDDQKLVINSAIFSNGYSK
jgi:hypothetical protein